MYSVALYRYEMLNIGRDKWHTEAFKSVLQKTDINKGVLNHVHKKRICGVP